MAEQKRYSEQFKLGAARLAVEQEYTYHEVADRLGATSWSVHQWVKKYRATGDLPPKDQPVPEAAELKALRNDNDRLRMENEILKQATAYFAKESL